MKRSLRVVLVLTLLLGMAVLWWKNSSQPPPPAEASATPQVLVKVKVERSRRLQVSALSIAQGTLFPLRQATVSAVQGGVIAEMPLWKNRRVQQGETLAVLNMRDLEAQRNEALALVREAEVNLSNLQNSSTLVASANATRDLEQTAASLQTARALYRRRKALFDNEGIALKDLQDSQLALSIAQANYTLSQRSAQLLRSATLPGSLELARTKLSQAHLRVASLNSPLSFANIRAPISGTVIDQFQFLGEYVTPGTRLVTIVDLSEMIVKAQFADTVLAQLQVGEAAEVRPLDRPGVKLSGRVSVLSAVTDAQSRSGEVWVNLRNSDARLRSGGFCEVTVHPPRKAAVVVSNSALTLESPESTQGWLSVVDAGGIAHRRAVVRGIHQGDAVEIVSGLKVGEQVVTQGNYNLADGTPVEIQP